MCENSHELVSGGNQTYLQLLEGVLITIAVVGIAPPKREFAGNPQSLVHLQHNTKQNETTQHIDPSSLVSPVACSLICQDRQLVNILMITLK